MFEGYCQKCFIEAQNQRFHEAKRTEEQLVRPLEGLPRLPAGPASFTGVIAGFLLLSSREKPGGKVSLAPGLDMQQFLLIFWPKFAFEFI